MTSHMSSERRRFDRHPFTSRLEVTTPRAIDRLHAEAIDVSVGGFGFRTSAPLEPGEVISVSMPELHAYDDAHDFPDVPSLRIHAIVRHVSATAGGGWVIGAERHA
jgi:hypothetical protein